MRSLSPWIFFSVLALLAVVAALTNEEQADTPDGEVAGLLKRSKQLVLRAQSSRMRVYFRSAEALLREGLRKRQRGRKQFYVALGQLQISRAYFDSRVSAAPPELPSM